MEKKGDQNSGGKKRRSKFRWKKKSYRILDDIRCDSHPIVAQCVKGFNYRSRPYIKAILGKDKKNVYNNDDMHQSKQFCKRS